MPEHVHDTDTGFDLRYSRKDVIKLEPHSCILTIKKKVKDQIQIFEAEATLCELGKIGLVNLYIPAKNYRHIRIPMYNNTEDIIEIPEGITIEYLTTKIENQLPNTIPDFLQLCRYIDIICCE
ncbi:hypothetical protein G9A89_004000 [Geosiphon pyriformis]|nr:hypothetical protein G9A89_004000 [Geosiphon pyriformis]